MRVHVYPADVGRSGFIRIVWPAQVVGMLGHEVWTHQPSFSDASLQVDPFGQLSALPDCDVVVFQRPTDPRLLDVIPQLQRRGVRVVVDVDDDLGCVLPNHPRYASAQSAVGAWRSALGLADTVTCTTPALAKRYRGVVVPNCLPRSYADLRVTAPGDPLVVGWTGDMEERPGDLETLGASVWEMARRTGARFRVVGSHPGAVDRFFGDGLVETRPWSVDFDDYMSEVAAFDLGVVPLMMHPFNEAKSWLKGLEMASVGVPFLASPTEPYRLLHAEGAGVLVHRRTDWRRELCRLVGSEWLRGELVGRGMVAAERWSLERNAWRWEEAWS